MIIKHIESMKDWFIIGFHKDGIRGEIITHNEEVAEDIINCDLWGK
jgi:hypothetical protein